MNPTDGWVVLPAILCDLSQRQACRLLDRSRSTIRYRPDPAADEPKLVRKIKRLARRHPRFGYRRVHALLVRGGWTLNIKRVHRLWCDCRPENGRTRRPRVTRQVDDDLERSISKSSSVAESACGERTAAPDPRFLKISTFRANNARGSGVSIVDFSPVHRSERASWERIHCEKRGPEERLNRSAERRGTVWNTWNTFSGMIIDESWGRGAIPTIVVRSTGRGSYEDGGAR